LELQSLCFNLFALRNQDRVLVKPPPFRVLLPSGARLKLNKWISIVFTPKSELINMSFVRECTNRLIDGGFKPMPQRCGR